ncbi:XapX domain-containing protein [Vibrio coralliilyticus]|uniref:XapX domain-containing protein n=1 Tax=Vibrio coralliilyticus TaxID=190893 RepID=UPI0003005C8A|nr:XapX domain-containing protein [Vibrio coralliilyticus]NOI76488.1 XapX domain-containing protein [Vibrio coralliilyticus]PAW03549.1 XapX domain-containing protein [Vibrio coralliilyticus]QOU29107.1 XapX domain-containing protein [Vibrio coralliilyticus]
MEFFLAALTGLVVGVLFSAIKLSMPISPVFWCVGVVRIELGGVTYQWIIEKFLASAC